MKYNINFIGRDNINTDDINKLLIKTKLIRYTSPLFDEDLYNSFKRFLSPPRHIANEGKKINYTKRQLEIIYSKNKEQRIKGVVGSGKTTILAARAVEAYKRTGGKILILTYNITLKIISTIKSVMFGKILHGKISS